MARTKFNWKRKRQLTTKKTFNCSQEVKAKIKKEKFRSLNEKTIKNVLSCQNSFAGCYAADELKHLFIKPPCFIIVNLDQRNMKGSHWIAIGCFQKKLELFDPLGFDLFAWPRISCSLLHFLHNYSFSRKIKISKRLQSSNSILCGLYCIFYVLSRPFKSFESIQSVFSSNLALNDSILRSSFSPLIIFYLDEL